MLCAMGVILRMVTCVGRLLCPLLWYKCELVGRLRSLTWCGGRFWFWLFLCLMVGGGYDGRPSYRGTLMTLWICMPRGLVGMWRFMSNRGS